MPFTQTSVIEITTFGRSDSGQSILNVFHYRQQSADPQNYDNVDLQEAIADFRGFWIASILPLVSTAYKVEKYRGRALTGTIANPTPPPATQIVVGEQAEFIAPAGEVGTRVGLEDISFAALGAQKLSARAGRNFRGSSRFGTLSASDVVENELDATYLALAITNTDTFFKAILTLVFDAVNWEHCIFSRTLALAAPPPFTLMRDLTAKVLGSKVNKFVTSQVSRKQSLSSLT